MRNWGHAFYKKNVKMLESCACATGHIAKQQESVMTMVKNITKAFVAAAVSLATAVSLQAGLVKSYPIAPEYLNTKVCDYVIDQREYGVCYDKNLKAARAVAYSLDRRVNKKIKKRGAWTVDRNLRASERASPKDYTRTGYNRGHLCPDASKDHNKRAMQSTYVMSNAVAMYPLINRKLWLASENYERYVASKTGKAFVLNVVTYAKNPPRIGRNRIAVPKTFYKKVWWDGGERCFRYRNEKNPDLDKPLKSHIIGCEQMPRF